MAERRRRTAPKRGLIGPLAMLAGGILASVLLWRFLMLDGVPPPGFHVPASERLTPADRQALERLLDGRRASR